jgi:hypothetical protein
VVEIKITEDMGEVLSIYPQVSTVSCESGDGRVTYVGKLVCTIVYTDEGGKLCRIQKGAEFTHHIENEEIAPSNSCVCKLVCEKIKHKRDGSAYIIDSVICADVDIYTLSERSFITSIDGAICDSKNITVANIIKFSGEGEVEDEFECTAEDILIPTASVALTNCTCGKGVVEAEGEIYLTMLAVRDGSPVCFDRVIPFKNELVCEDAIASCVAGCNVEIKDLNVTAKVNEEKGKCSVSLTAQLIFSGNFAETDEINAVVDAFSEECELELYSSCEEYPVYSDIKNYSERVAGKCAVKANIDYTCAFKAVALPKAEWTFSDGGIAGTVYANLLYEQGGEMRSTEINLPFTYTLNGVESGDNISIAVCGMSVRQREEGECEGEAVLKISVAGCKMLKSTYLSDVKEGNALEENDSAISVYIPCRGDDLWQTAKRLRRSPQSIEKTNPELKFPLTGEERIVVYRNKTA